MRKLINFLLTIVLLVSISSCSAISGDPGAKKDIGERATYVVAPSKSVFYPTTEEISILESGFSADEMQWQEHEIAAINKHRYGLQGLFDFIDTKKNVSSQVTFAELNSVKEQGLHHYKALKTLLDSRKEELKQDYIEAWVIYNNRIVFIEQAINELEIYLSQREYEISEEAKAMDLSFFSKAFEAIEPLVGVFL